MKRTLIASLIILFTSALFAQECKFYYPKNQGAQLEYASFDSKEKLTGSNIQTVKEISKNDNSFSALIEVQSFDKKGKDLGKKEYPVKCENGVFLADMKSYLDPATMEAYKDMELKVTSNNLVIPAELNVGDELANGNLNISVYSNGTRVMGMSTVITQRKVEAKEEITTEAGTFDCFKITYTITVSTMFSVRMEAADWIAEGVGTVKSETYSKGKTLGYTLLKGIK